jgi:transcriptional regulator with XRE-family HTH domain
MDASVHPVRAYRLAKKPHVKLEDLAQRIGTTKANLSRIETGKQKLSEDLLPKLVAETGISASRLRPDLAKLFTRSSPRPGRRGRKAAA